MSDKIREAFDAWRSSSGWTRPDDPGEWAAWQAALAQQPAQVAAGIPAIPEQLARDLTRFNETCEDGQEYDTPKDRMRAMASFGLVRWCGGSRFEITDCGIAALEAMASPTAAEQPYSTTSDQYRAELYDEVWEKARGIGYGNVTMALAELERMKAAEQPDTVKVSRGLLERMANDIAYAVFNLADKKLAGLRRGIVETSNPADTALIVERELRALLPEVRNERRPD